MNEWMNECLIVIEEIILKAKNWTWWRCFVVKIFFIWMNECKVNIEEFILKAKNWT